MEAGGVGEGDKHIADHLGVSQVIPPWPFIARTMPARTLWTQAKNEVKTVVLFPTLSIAATTCYLSTVPLPGDECFVESVM